MTRFDVCLGRVRLFVTPWTVAHQTSLSMEFSRQECWSGLSFPSPRDLPHPGIKPSSLVSPAMAGRFFTTAPPGKPCPQRCWKFPSTNTQQVLIRRLLQQWSSIFTACQNHLEGFDESWYLGCTQSNETNQNSPKLGSRYQSSLKAAQVILMCT